MSANETNVNNIGSSLYPLKFAVLMVLEIPSILVSLIILTYFALIRTTRSKDHNHSMLVLISINLLQVVTDLPMPISYFHSGGIVRPATSAYCTWWIWYEFSLNSIDGLLMAWIAIERHLLVFHAHLIRGVGTWKRWSLHVAPMIFCLLWGPLSYIIIIIVSPMCTNKWLFDTLLCGLPCYLSSNWSSFGLIFNIISPVGIIAIANLVLVARVIHHQVTGLHRTRVNWRRQQKMVLQLGFVSMLYLAIWLPVCIQILGELYISRTFLSAQVDAFNYILYLRPLLLPFVCFMSMPELVQKLKTKLFQRRPIAVAPIILKLNTLQNTNNIAMVAAIE